MSYEGTHVAQLNHIKSLAASVKARLDTTIKFVSVSGNTISFFKTADGSGTAAYTVDFPSEFFLDQTKTTFVNSFAFSAATYPGATDPSLNGKPVLILAVKGTDNSVSYSFLNMASLIDTYTVATGDSAKVFTISGRTVTFKVSAAANQAITVKSDGLHVDVSDKADKVSSATNGNLAGLDANGNLTDSGVSKSTVTGYATTIAAKIDKVTSATENRVAAFVSDGGLKDSGILYTAILTTSHLATDTEMTEVLTEIFGS